MNDHQPEARPFTVRINDELATHVRVVTSYLQRDDPSLTLGSFVEDALASHLAALVKQRQRYDPSLTLASFIETASASVSGGNGLRRGPQLRTTVTPNRRPRKRHHHDTSTVSAGNGTTTQETP